jgi:polyisoprenoid-binding protein YceI
MAEPTTLYTISPSEDSTIAVELLRTGPLARKKKQTLFFESFHGEMHMATDHPASSRILLAVDAASVVCRDTSLTVKDERTGRLVHVVRVKQRQAVAGFVRKQALAAATYPEIRFTSTSIRAKALRGFVVTGILQIREISRELKVNLSLGPTTRTRAFQLDADAPLRLSDFGLPRPSAMLGLIGTSDDAVLHLRLWAVPAPDAP